jgi:hypothetical protein
MEARQRESRKHALAKIFYEKVLAFRGSALVWKDRGKLKGWLCSKRESDSERRAKRLACEGLPGVYSCQTSLSVEPRPE